MHRPYLSRKESIVTCAIDIIDELGLEALSTREIARRQQISEAAIYRHFNSKRDIVLGVFDLYSQFDMDIFRTVEDSKLSCKEGIMLYVKAYAEYYENYPAITSIFFIHDVLSYEEKIAETIRQINNGRFEFLKKLVEEGQKNGEIIPDISSSTISHNILGTLKSIIFYWRINGRSVPLKQALVSSFEEFIKLL